MGGKVIDINIKYPGLPPVSLVLQREAFFKKVLDALNANQTDNADLATYKKYVLGNVDNLARHINVALRDINVHRDSYEKQVYLITLGG